jgi:predicted DNA-binding transcriptional regulator YafY
MGRASGLRNRYGDVNRRWVRARVAVPTALGLARNLAGWGTDIEVLDPPAVRTELVRIGAELAARYQGPKATPP